MEPVRGVAISAGVLPSGPLLLAGTALFTLAAWTAVVIAPDRLQLVFYIDSTGANEVVVPVGYWMAAALWAWLTMRTLDVPVAKLVRPAIAIALSFHVLLLTATFARQLPDAPTFSSGFYRVYARLFCGAVLAGAVWWSFRILRQLHQRLASLAALELPIVAGAVVLLAALMRYDVTVAACSVVLVLAVVLLQARPPLVSLPVFRRAIDNERLFLIVLFLVAVALRILYLQRVMTNPNYVETGGDGAVYDALAWSIATGHGVPDSFRNGYPLLLLGYVWWAGAVYAIAGHSYFALGAVQSVLGAAACLLLHAVSKSLFDSGVARVAAMFAAVSFPLIFAAAAIGHQAIDVFLTLLVTWLLLRTIERQDQPGQARDIWRWAGIGVTLGCAIAVRETNAFLLAFVFCWMAVVFRRALTSDRLRAVVAVAAGVTVVIVPLMLPMLSSSDGRLRLRQHFDRLYQGQGDAVRTRKDLVGPLEDPTAALSQFRTQPGLVASTLGRAIAHNFALQFFTQPFGGFDLVFLTKGSAYYYGQWFYAYALACAGLLVAVRQAIAGGARAIGAALVIGVIVSRTLPHLLLESHYRHRVPIEPLLILLASIAAVGLLRSIRASHLALVPLDRQLPLRA